jgi:hypothetical protein
VSTQNFDFVTTISHKVIKDIYVTVKEWKLQLVIVVTFRLELRLSHEYKH